MTIAPSANGWNNPNRNYARKMIPAVETVEVNDWLDEPRAWVMSEKWKGPKLIRKVRGDLVCLAQMWRGKLYGTRPVRAFPEDVHEVPPPVATEVAP